MPTHPHPDRRQPRKTALRGAVDAILADLAQGSISLEFAGHALDFAGLSFSAQCRVLLPYRDTP